MLMITPAICIEIHWLNKTGIIVPISTQVKFSEQECFTMRWDNRNQMRELWIFCASMDFEWTVLLVTI